MNVKRLRFPIGIAVILAAIAWLVFSSTASTGAYYMTVGEFLPRRAEIGSHPLKVAGHVVTGSIDRQAERSELRFVIADPEHPDQTLPVVYRRAAVPDTFKDGAEAVVEGTVTPDGVFEAKTLFAKCPSKYEAKQPAGTSPAAPVSS